MPGKRSGCLAALAVRPIHAAAGVLVALFVAASAQAAGQGNAAVAPDLVLKSGAIYTVDGARSWAQAVAIRAGHIVYVGTDRGVAAYVTPSTRVVDLKGKMVLPSFQDVHIHPISAGIQANSCTLDGLKTAFRSMLPRSRSARTLTPRPPGSPAAAGGFRPLEPAAGRAAS